MENFVFYGDYGHVLYKIKDGECFIEVAEDKRNQGYGTKLMKDFFNDVPECYVFHLMAYANESYNSLPLKALIRFYTNLGFVADEEQLKDIENSNNLDDELTSKIFMRKVAD